MRNGHDMYGWNLTLVRPHGFLFSFTRPSPGTAWLCPLALPATEWFIRKSIPLLSRSLSPPAAVLTALYATLPCSFYCVVIGVFTGTWVRILHTELLMTGSIASLLRFQLPAILLLRNPSSFPDWLCTPSLRAVRCAYKCACVCVKVHATWGGGGWAENSDGELSACLGRSEAMTKIYARAQYVCVVAPLVSGARG